MYEAMVKRLSDAAAACDFKVEQTKQNIEKLKQLEEKIASAKYQIAYCNSVAESLTPMISDITKYANEKAKNGQLMINQALNIAGEVIPDSMKGISFKTEGDKAWLEVDEMFADDTEGSGYKGATSMFIQSAILKQNQNVLQTMILDEPLAKVSTENSAIISAVLPYICKDLQVILIEQKKEVFANFDHVAYSFFKDECGTRVEREDVFFKEASV